MERKCSLLIPRTKCLRKLLQDRDHLTVDETIVEQVQKKLNTTVRVI